MKRRHIGALLLLIISSNLLGQENETTKRPLSISLLNESISVPLVSPIKYGFNPAIILSTKSSFKKRKKFYIGQVLGYYHHKDWESALFEEATLGYEIGNKRVTVSPQFGLGYAHVFSLKPVYKFKDGEFKRVQETGSPVAQSSFQICTAYKLESISNSPSINLIYRFALQLPYSDYGGFHQFVGLGTTIHPFKN